MTSFTFVTVLCCTISLTASAISLAIKEMLHCIISLAVTPLVIKTELLYILTSLIISFSSFVIKTELLCILTSLAICNQDKGAVLSYLSCNHLIEWLLVFKFEDVRGFAEIVERFKDDSCLNTLISKSYCSKTIKSSYL